VNAAAVHIAAVDAVAVNDLTTVDLFIVAPRAAAGFRRRAKAAERRAAGLVPHRRDRSRDRDREP
jgi:hypothetical protein